HTVSEAVVRGTIGQPVTLPCSYRVTRSKDIADMCWGRGPCPNSKCSNKFLQTTRSRVTFRTSQRYSLRGYISFGDVSLTIGAAQAEDAGVYCCRVEIPGLFNDIKNNIRLELARAPPVTTTTTSSKHFRETTFAPQETSDLQPTPEPAALLPTSTLPAAITATEPPAETTWETFAPPTIAVTENDIFPATVVETSAVPGFPTTFPVADVTIEDVVFCTTEPGPLPWSTEETTEFPDTFPAAEETTTSLMMEEMSVLATTLPVPATLQTPKIPLPFQVSSNSWSHQPGCTCCQNLTLTCGTCMSHSAILIACVTAGSILSILMLSLFWKRKHIKKFVIKSLGPPEESEKVFSGAEGENNIYTL
ncbi:TIMD4 protein, partial [Ptilonorhynchus violaceus]|nr:TIMD4 protein [Ptilonorhynchus violaceus]